MPMTAAQIVQDACAIAKCPGYTALAGRQLNLVLNDLSLKRDLKANLVTEYIPITTNSNGPFNLPANYLRTYNMFYLVSSVPYFLNPCSLKEYDAETQQQGLASYPYEWASDLSAVPTGGVGIFYVYPQSGTVITLTHRYYLVQPDIATPQSSNAIPWFADQDYLMTALAARMMRTTDDDRMAQFEQMAENILRPYLIEQGDEQNVVKEIQLDPRRFRLRGNLPANKVDPFSLT